MNCVRCRRPIQTGARWCAFCGEPVQPARGQTQPLPEGAEATSYDDRPPEATIDRPLPAGGASIAALIFAIVGLIGPLPIVGSLLALAFARRGRRDAMYGTAGGAEIARAARIIAWTGIILLLVAAAIGAAVVAIARYNDGGLLG